ncbi:MAG: 3-phosphoglycerate dehydrogenase [Ignavibacteria bacterium]|nr:3-phosphoglycerate dehydrogenase [Ignavibacteria bacterium]
MKGKINIFAADFVHPHGIELLKKKFNVFVLPPLDNTALLKELSSYGAARGALVVRSTRKVDSAFLRSLAEKTNIDLVCTVSSGYDNIDLDACKKFKIKAMNVAGANSIAAAEFTMALILAITKNIVPADRDMKKGKFESGAFSNTELNGKTIGIIGVGRIGSKVAKLSRAFGMNVLGNDIKASVRSKHKSIRFVSLNTLLAGSDFVTIHTPLDGSTHNLLNSTNLKSLKKEAVIINCSRGGTIDERALLKALKSGKAAYAGIDVFENEPAFNRQFARLSNVLITPHLAGKTIESKERMAVEAARKIIKFYTKKLTSAELIN